MWRNPSLAHPGAWLCLVGSILALAAFFLPAYGRPAGSLGAILLIILGAQEPGVLSEGIALSIGLLSLLLVSVTVLAGRAVFVGSRRKPLLLHWHWGLAFVTLFLYFFATLMSLLIIYAEAAMIGESLLDAVGPVNIGVWLLPTGLILALIGNHLWQGKLKPGG